MQKSQIIEEKIKKLQEDLKKQRKIEKEKKLQNARKVNQAIVNCIEEIIGSKCGYINWEEVFQVLKNSANLPDVNLVLDSDIGMENLLSCLSELRK